MNEQELRERIGVAVESLVAAQIGELIPAAVIEIRYQGEVVYTGAYGEAEPGQPARLDTLFDLGGLTTLFTTTAFLRLVDAGRLWIDTPVNVVLPDVAEDLSFYHLLTESGSLSEEIDLCALPDYDSRLAAVEAAARAPGSGETGMYEMNAILLGWAIEALMTLPLDQAVALLVLQPLSLHAEYAPLSKNASVAQLTPEIERQPYDAVTRCMEDVAGHSGLFGTASDVATLAQVYLSSGLFNGVQVLSPEVTSEATREHANERGLGWTFGGEVYRGLSDTGTWVIVDAPRQLVLSLMTNCDCHAENDWRAESLYNLWDALLEKLRQIVAE